MLPDRYAPRAWASEPLDDVLGRLDDQVPHLVIVLDPRSAATCGTIGSSRLGGLFRNPDLWGRHPSAA